MSFELGSFVGHSLLREKLVQIYVGIVSLVEGSSLALSSLHENIQKVGKAKEVTIVWEWQADGCILWCF